MQSVHPSSPHEGSQLWPGTESLREASPPAVRLPHSGPRVPTDTRQGRAPTDRGEVTRVPPGRFHPPDPPDRLRSFADVSAPFAASPSREGETTCGRSSGATVCPCAGQWLPSHSQPRCHLRTQIVAPIQMRARTIRRSSSDRAPLDQNGPPHQG